jgi:hypothetical protein
MANRSFRPPLGALEVDVVELFAKLTIGATGGVTAVSTTSKGFASFTKESSAGQYTLALSDSYNSLLFAGITLLDATDSDPAAVGCSFRVLSEDVDHTSTPNVVIQAYTTDDGAAANPRDGAVVQVMLKLKNSSVT